MSRMRHKIGSNQLSMRLSQTKIASCADNIKVNDIRSPLSRSLLLSLGSTRPKKVADRSPAGADSWKSDAESVAEILCGVIHCGAGK